ncbi:hypothetical protein [Bradyrhizobium sp. ORS 86]
MLSFLTIVGGLVWYPVKEGQERQQRVIEKMAEATVTQKDLDIRLAATTDDGPRRSEANAMPKQSTSYRRPMFRVVGMRRSGAPSTMRSSATSRGSMKSQK